MSKDADSRIIKLPRTTYAPSVDDLQYVVQRARTNEGFKVESTWVPLGSPKMYQLAVICANRGSKLIWTLHEHAGTQVIPLWKAETLKLEDVAAQIGKLSDAVEVRAAPRPEVISEMLAQATMPVTAGRSDAVPEVYEKVNELSFLGSAADAVDHMRNQLVHAESGAYSYSVLVKFIEYECARFQTFNVPVSLILFEIRDKDGKPIPPIAATTAVLRFQLIKHKLDIVGRFEESDFALVLPNTQAAAAQFVANKAVDILTSSPLSATLNKQTLQVLIGVAGLPDDAEDTNSLIAAAKRAKERARKARAAAAIPNVAQS